MHRVAALAGFAVVVAGGPANAAETSKAVVPPLGEVGHGIWDYPVKPGTAEYKKGLAAGKTPWELVQLPDGMAATMSTRELVEAVMKYPLAIDLYAFPTSGQAISIMRSRFNGMEELLKRSDAARHLTDHLAAMPVDRVLESGRTRQRPNYSDIWLISSLLGNEDVLHNLSRADASSMAKAC